MAPLREHDAGQALQSCNVGDLNPGRFAWKDRNSETTAFCKLASGQNPVFDVPMLSLAQHIDKS